MVAGTSHVEIRQYFIYGDDLFSQFPHLEEESIVIMNAQLAEGIFFVTFRPYKGRRMIPVSGGLELSGSCSLDKGTAVCLMHSYIGIHKITSRLPECLYRCLDRLRLVPVITVDNADNVSGSIADSFIHGIVDPAVRFAENVITDTLRL